MEDEELTFYAGRLFSLRFLFRGEMITELGGECRSQDIPNRSALAIRAMVERARR